MRSPPPFPREPLRSISVVIPARNEEGCIAATVEHLHLELRLQQIPHEIVVVDDGSTDSTWGMLQEIHTRIPECKPVQNLDDHGFGRAITYGFNHITGDAVVVMMADESDDNFSRPNQGTILAPKAGRTGRQKKTRTECRAVPAPQGQTEFLQHITSGYEETDGRSGSHS